MERTIQRFAPALRRVAQELDVPSGVRGAILLEMASDLESVWEQLKAEGVDDAEAARRAESMVLGSDDVLRRLAELHRRRRPQRPQWLAERLAGGAELVLVVAAAVPVVLLSAGVATRTLIIAPTAVGWLLLALGLAIPGIVAVQALRPRPGQLVVLPVLGAVAAGVGLLAALLSTWRFASAAAVADSAAVMRQVEVAGASLLAGFALGITAVFAWFVLLHRAAARTAREVDLLLGGESSPVGRTAVTGQLDVLPLIRRRRA